MGADIHIYSESKNEQGIWELDQTIHRDPDEPHPYLEDIPCDRDYGLFGLLANVRYSHELGFTARDVPEDASDGFKQVVKDWAGDGHSHSYLSIDELRVRATELLVSHTDDCIRLVNAISTLLHAVPESDSKEQRIVFFFDN